MAKSREAVKLSQIYEMSHAGSDEIREYIQARIEDTRRERDGAANGPEKLMNLLKILSEGLDAKTGRKDATEWLVSKDETRAAKLLVETRAVLARVDDLTKEKGDVLIAERMRAEILAALMEYVLAAGQKQKHAQLTPMYVEAIKQYGTDADRALLADAGYGSGVANALGSFFSFGESEADKRNRAKAKRNEIQVVMAQKQNKPDTLAYAISNLANSTDAFAKLFAENPDKIIDDLAHFALDSDKMEAVGNASLVAIAASLEPVANFINKLVHEIGIENDPPVDQRLILARKLLAVHELLIEQRHKLAGIMLERLKMLDENVLAGLDPKNIDFNRRYECDKRVAAWRAEGRGEEAIDLVRQAAEKTENKKFDTLNAATIIKYQAYIAKCGSADQRAQLHEMQGIHLGVTESTNWLQVKLDSWQMSCPQEFKSVLLGLQEKHKYFETNAELSVLKKLIEVMVGYRDKTAMLRVLQYADNSSFVTTKEEFANFSRFVEDFRNTPPLDSGKDKTLERLIKMCDDSGEFSMLVSRYFDLDPRQKQMFLRFIEFQNKQVEPNDYVVTDLAGALSVLSLLEKGKHDAAVLDMYDALFEKFKDKDPANIMSVLSTCSKLIDESHQFHKPPHLIMLCLQHAEDPTQLLGYLDHIDGLLEDKLFLANLYNVFSVREINELVYQGGKQPDVTDLGLDALIAAQHAAIGDVCEERGSEILHDMIEGGLIDVTSKEDLKEAAANVIELVNTAKSVMDAISNPQINDEDTEKKLNELLDVIVAFKSSWKDKDAWTHTVADELISKLLNELSPTFTEQSDKKMVMLVNLVKAIAKTPSTGTPEGRNVISSTLNLSRGYIGDNDGEQKLLGMVVNSLRLVHEKQPKHEDINSTIKSLHDFESSAKMKGLILRFARAVMTLIGKVNKAAETKSRELDQKVGLFETKAKSAKTMREQMQDRKNEIKPQRS